jgi:hypothetical protein
VWKSLSLREKVEVRALIFPSSLPFSRREKGVFISGGVAA